MPGFSHARPTLRNALARTIADKKLMGVELSKRTGVAGSLISRYQKGRQDMMTANLDILLDGLTMDEFRHFMAILCQGEHMLAEIERGLLDPEIGFQTRYSAFHAWFTAFINEECDSSEIVDLIALLGECLKAKMQAAADHETDTS